MASRAPAPHLRSLGTPLAVVINPFEITIEIKHSPLTRRHHLVLTVTAQVRLILRGALTFAQAQHSYSIKLRINFTVAGDTSFTLLISISGVVLEKIEAFETYIKPVTKK